MKKYLASSVALMVSTPLFASENIQGFNRLQTNSEAFVRSTCVGFVKNKDAKTADQQQLFDVCGSMVHSVNALVDNGGTTTKDRGLNAETLAGGFQNIVPEETLAPVNLSANTSSINLAAINSRLAKIRFGGGAGDDLFSATQLGFFINGTGGFGSMDQTTQQDANNFDSKGVISGFDYKLTENMIVGLAGSYSFFDLDFNQNINEAGGSVKADNYSITGYSNYALSNGYVEGVFTYGWSDYNLTRNIFIDSKTAISQVNSTAIASPAGRQFSASLAGGYDFHAGGLSYGPYARMAYFESYIDSYNESGAGGLNLHLAKHKSDSLETVLGVQFNYALSQSFGVLVPHIKGEWHHEYKNNIRAFNVTYVNDPRQNIYQSISNAPDRNFFNISAGFSADLKYGVQAFFDYQTILGLNNIDAHKFTAGFRIEL